MDGPCACSLLLQLRPHRDDGVRARRRGAVGATVDVKPVDGDGPGNRLRRLQIFNSTRQRRHAGTVAGRCGSRDRALSRSAPLARWPDDRSLRSPSSIPHRQGAENRRCGLQGRDVSADVFACCPHQQIAGFVDDGLHRRRQRRQMAGERHPVLDGRHRRLDRAASLMAENQQEREL
jgi:hypothetical protein